MTGDNPVIEFNSQHRHAVKVYKGDFHGLARNVSLIITSDPWIYLTHIKRFFFSICFAGYSNALTVNEKLPLVVIITDFNYYQILFCAYHLFLSQASFTL